MPKVLSAVRALLFGSAGSQAVALGVSGDSNPRLRIDAGGRLTWGTGAAAGDIYVERSGVNSLLVSGEVLADSYQVDVAATPTGAIGKLIWNDTEGTLDLGLKGGNVTLPVGQSLTQRVSNVTGASMARGKAVYLTGAQGNRTTVALARANAENTSSKTFGITSEAISDNGSGFVITEGLLTGLDTSALTEGSIVWLSAATAGALTTTKPTAPDHGVMVGLCVRSHASVGILLVKVQNGYELEELHNVSISTPTDGQVLTYDAALTLWKNANSSGGGGGASVSVGDTAPASPSEGDLWFDSSNLKSYIYYDSSWVEIGGGTGGGGQYTVSDTAPTAPGTGDVWYDSTTGKQYIYYDLFWVEMTTSNALSVASHASTHIRGGSDIIDGDQLQVDYVPSAYTRNAAAAGAGAVTDLTAHLAGIDAICGPGHRVATTAQKNALTGVATGTMVYDTTLGCLQVWNGTIWTFPIKRISVKVYKTANQLLSSGSNPSWNASEWDTDPNGPMWTLATNPDRITVRTSGLYQVTWNGRWNGTASSTPGVSTIIYKNTSPVHAAGPGYLSVNQGYWSHTAQIAAVASDYFRFELGISGVTAPNMNGSATPDYTTTSAVVTLIGT
jgi:hypothetical protein